MAVNNVAEFDRNLVVQMFQEMGFTDITKVAGDDNALLERVKKLEKHVNEDPDLKPDTPEAEACFQEILEALVEDNEIALTGELTLPTTNNGDEPPKKRGRKKGSTNKEKKPKKPKKVKKGKEKEPEPEPYEELIEYKWEEKDAPRLLKLNSKLVEEWRTLPRLPRDREVQEARLAYLRGEVEGGRFRGSDWIKVYVEETETTYGINGKHTSIVLEEALKNGKKLSITMKIESWQCKTMEDAAALYRTIDAKEGAKTKQDELKCLSGTHELTKDIPGNVLNVITAGIAFAKWERGYRRHKPLVQGKLMLKHDDFAAWCADLLKADKEDKKKCKHLFRVPVVAAIFKTWQKDHEAASEFWTAIRDDCDDTLKAPRRRLYKWLKEEVKFGAPGKDKKGVVTDREGYHGCLKAWNCWRGDLQGTEDEWKHRYSVSDRTPEVK